ncbi:hypothetical protein ID964_004509 [Salmonella enterica]|nr:hypothetical protein [Salmonella enterica]
MTFPSEVIYELANTLRRRYNYHMLQTSVGATAAFLRNHFLGSNQSSITQEVIFSIDRTAKILPIDGAIATQNGDMFNFSMGMRHTSVAVNPSVGIDQAFMHNPYPLPDNWFVVVEQGVNQYEVVAARDEFFFDLGQISRRLDIALELRQGNIGLNGGVVYFILSNWAHVSYVLRKADATFHATEVSYLSAENEVQDEEEIVPGTEVAVCEDFDDLKSVFVKRDIFESLNLDFPGDENEISVADLVEALCQKDQANEISDEEAELFQVQQLVSKVIGGQEILDTLMALPPKKRTQKYIRELVLENLGQTKK